MLNNLPIRYKLAMLSATFLVPILFLTWLLILQSMKDIDFSAKEVDGNNYLIPVRSLLLHAIDAQHATPVTVEQLTGLRQDLGAVAAIERALGDAMTSTEVAQPLLTAASALATTPAPPDFAEKMKGVITQTRDLIARVGDGSNLILDPDLDSYYTMDLLIGKIPELVDRMGAITHVVLDNLATAEPTTEQHGQFMVAKGELASTMAGIDNSVAAAYRGSADGSLKATFATPYAALKAALGRFSAQLDAGASLDKATARPTATELESLRRDTQKAAAAFWQVIAEEMDRLLVIRIAGFRNKLVISLLATVVVVIAAFALAWYISRSIGRPLASLQSVMKTLANGNTGVDVPFRQRKDEVGQMAESVEIFRLHDVDRLVLQEREQSDAARRQHRQARIDGLVHEFDEVVVSMLGRVASSVDHVHKTSESMAATAIQTSWQGHNVFSATEQAIGSVESVAAATEELKGSIHEIASQVSRAADVAQLANQQSEAANGRIRGLESAAQRIGEVVKLINTIASQTNLLALNATIEAARAGEAGKGFAVVANEVKALANQTAQATEDISTQVQAIQSETQDAVQALNDIAETIGNIWRLSTAIAGAVEEQEAATSEIARAATTVVGESRDVMNTITAVIDAAEGTGRAASEVFLAASTLLEESESLQKKVKVFLDDVREA